MDIFIIFGNAVAFILFLSFSILVTNLARNSQKDNVYGNIVYLILLSSIVLTISMFIEVLDGLMIIVGITSIGLLSYISLTLIIVSLSFMIFVYDEWYNKEGDNYNMVYYPVIMIMLSVTILITIIHSYNIDYNGIPNMSAILIMLLSVFTHLLFSIKSYEKSKHAVKGLLKWRLRFLSIASVFFTLWISTIMISMLFSVSETHYILSYISISLLIISIIFQWFGWITPNKLKKYVRWR